MIGPEFSSCRLKIGRAREHLNAFDAELAEWRDSKPYAIDKQCNPDGSRYSVFVKINRKPDVERWSLIGGDCIHNLRSALDHVVYALAIKNSGRNPPPNEKRSLEFPIFDSEEEFRKRIWRIEPLSDAAKTFIEGLQPYQAGNPQRSFLLRTINEFDNSDKHRLLHVAVNRMGSGEFQFDPPFSGLKPNIKWNLKPIEDGAELAYFTLNPPQLDVKYKI